MVNLHLKKLIVLLTVVLALAGTARAGDILRLYGDDNVGTASGLFMRIPVDVEPVFSRYE